MRCAKKICFNWKSEFFIVTLLSSIPFVLNEHIDRIFSDSIPKIVKNEKNTSKRQVVCQVGRRQKDRSWAGCARISYEITIKENHAISLIREEEFYNFREEKLNWNNKEGIIEIHLYLTFPYKNMHVTFYMKESNLLTAKLVYGK